MALVDDMRGDPSTNIGARTWGLRWPASQTWIYEHYQGDGLKGPVVTADERRVPSDEEVAEANRLLSPIFR